MQKSNFVNYSWVNSMINLADFPGKYCERCANPEKDGISEY